MVLLGAFVSLGLRASPRTDVVTSAILAFLG